MTPEQDITKGLGFISSKTGTPMNENLTAVFRKMFAILREKNAPPEAFARAREFARVGYQRFKHREAALMKSQAKRVRQLTDRAMNRIDWSRN